MDRAFTEPILHVDMDAFFVEVERLHDPALKGRPVVVGGGGNRGVVAAASYEARQYGVGSAMPMVEARRRCPQAVVVPPNHTRYGEVSARVFDILRSFTPLVESLSVDEAFLDVAGLRLHYDTPVAIAEAIRRRIRDELDLPASVGIAANKFLAKLASEEAKPDGIFCVPAGGELEFLHPLPVRRLWGVGEATYAALEALGVRTVGELAALPEQVVAHRLGPAVGHHLVELANARDPRSVEPGGDAKSISAEATYEQDLGEIGDIERALLGHCDRLSARLRRHGYAGRTITLKMRFADFTTITRSETVAVPIEHTADLWDVVRDLLVRVDRAGRGVRLLGVGAAGLVPGGAPRQLSMEHPQRDAAADAAEQVRARFGDDAVVPARLVDTPAPPQRGFREGAIRRDDQRR
jgi:DNA polymerase-4